MNQCISIQQNQAYALMEALIGMMIFSIGVLGVIGLQGNILNRNMDSSFRIQASLFANEMISMAVADYQNTSCFTVPATSCGSALATTFTQNWLTEIASNLPGSATNTPTVSLAADRTLTVTIFWQRAQDPILHNYVAATQLE